MMNLLVMPIGRADHIASEWNSSPVMIGCVVLGLLGFLVAIISFGYIFSMAVQLAVNGYHFNWKLFLAVLCTFILGVGAVSGFGKIIGVQDAQHEAVWNVRDYYKMKHLRAVYPKLPCKTKIEHNACTSKSLAQVSKDKRVAKHTFTKHKAVKKYDRIRAEYRNVGENGNGTKSITPKAPKFRYYF